MLIIFLFGYYGKDGFRKFIERYWYLSCFKIKEYEDKLED